MQDVGVDLGDRDLLRGRSWQWLETRILALLSRPVTYAPSGVPIYGTRLARHFYQQAAFDAVEREQAKQRR